ncbi:hypothetical protein Hanom_Chr09g00818741 [Helianthus anomalus]
MIFFSFFFLCVIWFFVSCLPLSIHVLLETPFLYQCSLQQYQVLFFLLSKTLLLSRRMIK